MTDRILKLNSENELVIVDAQTNEEKPIRPESLVKSIDDLSSELLKEGIEVDVDGTVNQDFSGDSGVISRTNITQNSNQLQLIHGNTQFDGVVKESSNKSFHLNTPQAANSGHRLSLQGVTNNREKTFQQLLTLQESFNYDVSGTEQAEVICEIESVDSANPTNELKWINDLNPNDSNRLTTVTHIHIPFPDRGFVVAGRADGSSLDILDSTDGSRLDNVSVSNPDYGTVAFTDDFIFAAENLAADVIDIRDKNNISANQLNSPNAENGVGISRDGQRCVTMSRSNDITSHNVPEGTERWTNSSISGFPQTDPAVTAIDNNGQNVYVTDPSIGSVCALDYSNGSKNWESVWDNNGSIVNAPPNTTLSVDTSESILIVVREFSDGTTDVAALSITNGSTLWTIFENNKKNKIIFQHFPSDNELYLRYDGKTIEKYSYTNSSTTKLSENRYSTFGDTVRHFDVDKSNDIIFDSDSREVARLSTNQPLGRLPSGRTGPRAVTGRPNGSFYNNGAVIQHGRQGKRAYQEVVNQKPESLSLDIDNSTVLSFDRKSNHNERKLTTINQETGSHTAKLQGISGFANVSIIVKEKTKPQDVTVDINGEQFSQSGNLSAENIVSFDVDKSNIKERNNNVSISSVANTNVLDLESNISVTEKNGRKSGKAVIQSKDIGFVPSSVFITDSSKVPTGATLQYKLTDENGNTVTVDSSDTETEVSTGNLSGTVITTEITMSRSSLSVVSPSLQNVFINFRK